MPRTPDRDPGTRLEEKLKLTSDDALTADTQGEMVYTGSAFSFRDSIGTFDPRSGSGLSEAQHKALRALIHFIDDGPADGFASGAYHVQLPSGDPFPTSAVWWESAAQTEKIVELTITRNANKTPATEVWKMFDTDGTTVLVTVTDTISYSGIVETTRTRTIA
jgi:hypothetical protein